VYFGNNSTKTMSKEFKFLYIDYEFGEIKAVFKDKYTHKLSKMSKKELSNSAINEENILAFRKMNEFTININNNCSA